MQSRELRGFPPIRPTTSRPFSILPNCWCCYSLRNLPPGIARRRVSKIVMPTDEIPFSSARLRCIRHDNQHHGQSAGKGETLIPRRRGAISLPLRRTSKIAVPRSRRAWTRPATTSFSTAISSDERMVRHYLSECRLRISRNADSGD